MSLAAYVWAAGLPLNACGMAAYRVLLHLADRADNLGYGAWPSVQTMAEALECSPRTIRRGVAELLDLGLIRLGDQRHVEHIRGDRRPVVYDVLTPALRYAEASDSRGDNFVTPCDSRGDSSCPPRGDNCCPINRPVNPPTKTSSVTHVGNRARANLHALPAGDAS